MKGEQGKTQWRSLVHLLVYEMFHFIKKRVFILQLGLEFLVQAKRNPKRVSYNLRSFRAETNREQDVHTAIVFALP